MDAPSPPRSLIGMQRLGQVGGYGGLGLKLADSPFFPDFSHGNLRGVKTFPNATVFVGSLGLCWIGTPSSTQPATWGVVSVDVRWLVSRAKAM